MKKWLLAFCFVFLGLTLSTGCVFLSGCGNTSTSQEVSQPPQNGENKAPIDTGDGEGIIGKDPAEDKDNEDNKDDNVNGNANPFDKTTWDTNFHFAIDIVTWTSHVEFVKGSESNKSNRGGYFSTSHYDEVGNLEDYDLAVVGSANKKQIHKDSENANQTEYINEISTVADVVYMFYGYSYMNSSHRRFDSITATANDGYMFCGVTKDFEYNEYKTPESGTYYIYGTGGWGESPQVTKSFETAKANCTSKNAVSDDNPNHFYVYFRKEYIISFDANGGTKAPEAQTRLAGVEFTLAKEKPTRDGYVFVGWTTEKNSKVPLKFAGDTVERNLLNDDTILYAVWQKEMKAISFNYNNTTPSLENVSITLNEADVLQVQDGSSPAYFSLDENSYFELIHNENGKSGLCGITINFTTTVPDQELKIKYDTNVEGNDIYIGKAICKFGLDVNDDLDNMNNYYHDFTLTIPETGQHNIKVFASIGADQYFKFKIENIKPVENETPYGELPEVQTHRFMGWYTERVGGVKVESTDIVNSDITLYAHWKDFDNNDFAIQYYLNGTDKPLEVNQKMEDGKLCDWNKEVFDMFTLGGKYDKVNFTATPKLGYAFVGIASSEFNLKSGNFDIACNTIDKRANCSDSYGKPSTHNNVYLSTITGEFDYEGQTELHVYFTPVNYLYNVNGNNAGFTTDYKTVLCNENATDGDSVKFNVNLRYGYTYTINVMTNGSNAEGVLKKKLPTAYSNTIEITLENQTIWDLFASIEYEKDKVNNVDVDCIYIEIEETAIDFSFNVHNMLNSHENLNFYTEMKENSPVEGIEKPFASIDGTLEAYNEKGESNSVILKTKKDLLGYKLWGDESTKIMFSESSSKPEEGNIAFKETVVGDKFLEIKGGFPTLLGALFDYFNKNGNLSEFQSATLTTENGIVKASRMTLDLWVYFDLQTYEFTYKTQVIGASSDTVGITAVMDWDLNIPHSLGGNANYVNAERSSNSIKYDVNYYTHVSLSFETSREDVRFAGYFLGGNLLSRDVNFKFDVSPFKDNNILSNLTITAKFDSYNVNTSGYAVSRVKGVYNLTTAEDLVWLSKSVADETYKGFEGILIKLAANIDMSGVILHPIGDRLHPFKGVFDGNGYVISNLTLVGGNGGNQQTLDYVGLFGCTEGATIKNLTLVGGSVSGYSYVGAVVANAKNTTFSRVNNFDVALKLNEVKFVNVYGAEVSDLNNSIKNDARLNFGGLVGYAVDCSFVGCSNRGEIVFSDDAQNVAGLVGYVVGGSIDQAFTKNGSLVKGENCALSNWFDAERYQIDNEALWTNVGGQKVLKIFYW